MPPDLDTLLDALEIAAFLLPELPGRVESYQADGVRFRETWDSDPFANLVGAATLNEENADAAIRDALSYFVEQNKAFGWVVGPRSTPWDLADRLYRFRVSVGGQLCRDGAPVPRNLHSNQPGGACVGGGGRGFRYCRLADGRRDGRGPGADARSDRGDVFR